MELAQPKAKILRCTEALERYRREGWSLPLTAEVDLTLRCSLNCKGCHSKWLHNPTELTEQQINRVVIQLLGVGVKSITWSGGGEPLESPHWRHAIEFASSLGFKQGLYSYLPEMDQEKVDWLSQRLEFVYGHNTPRSVVKPSNSRTVWTCGWLLDDKNWVDIEGMVQKVNWKLFDFVDFRPLIVPGMDYSWAPYAIEIFERLEGTPVLKWAKYKFEDLTKPNFGRSYKTCFSTDFVAVIGADGTVWECINRRGITPLGNVLTESLTDIWERKWHKREDMSQCRMLCRNHELNKTLDYIFGEAPVHAEFV